MYHLVSPISTLHTVDADPVQTWHRRLGHTLDEVLTHLNLNYKFNCKPCDCCHMAKYRLPFNKFQVDANVPFELLHMDLWGPYKIQSTQGFQYFLIIVDDCARPLWTILLVGKASVFKAIQTFGQMMCQNLFDSLVIVHQITCPYTSQ